MRNVGRRAVPVCGTCGALFADGARQTAEQVYRAALVDLATKVHARADDGPEGFTRRIQKIATDALRRGEEA